MSPGGPAIALLARGGFGGSTRVALLQAALAAERGQRVELFCEHDVPHDLRPREVPLHVWGSRPWPLPGGRTADGAGSEAVATRHADQPFDLVHAHFAFPHGEIARQLTDFAAAESLPVPARVVTLHGSDLLQAVGAPELGPILPTARRLRAFALRRALEGAVVTVPSESLLARAQSGGLGLKGVLVTPNFLPDGFFREAVPRSNPHRLRVLVAGSLRPVKRPTLAIAAALRAAAALAPRGTELSLELLGEGPEGPACQRMALGSPHGRRIRIRAPEPLAEHIWQATDVLLIASRYESFSLVALEALARGLPVVAPAVGGLPELMGHPSQGTPAATSTRGWLVPGELDGAGLERALAAALVEVAEAPALVAERGSRAAQYALIHHGPEAGRSILDRIAEHALGA